MYYPASLSGLDFSSIEVPQASNSSGASTFRNNMSDDPAMIRDMLLANPEQLSILQQNNPALAEAVLSGSLGKFLSFPIPVPSIYLLIFIKNKIIIFFKL